MVDLAHVLPAQQVGAETFAAQRTLERLDVDDHVTVQAAVGGEQGATRVAFERLHPCTREDQKR